MAAVILIKSHYSMGETGTTKYNRQQKSELTWVLGVGFNCPGKRAIKNAQNKTKLVNLYIAQSSVTVVYWLAMARRSAALEKSYKITANIATA